MRIDSVNFFPTLSPQVLNVKRLAKAACILVLFADIFKIFMDYYDPERFIQAKITTIDHASTIQVKQPLELLNDLESISHIEMKNCLSLHSYNIRNIVNKIDVFNYFHTQKEIKDYCYIRNIARYKDILNGRCAMSSSKVPLVLSVLSNRDIHEYLHEERIRIIPLKFLNAGCEIIMKYAKNPREICGFLDAAKTQFGRPVDHLLISGHGTPDSIMWEEGELNTTTRFPSGCFKSLALDATIGLLSCRTGAPLENGEKTDSIAADYSVNEIINKRNIAQHVSNEAQKQVFAPTINVANEDLEVIKAPNSSLSLKFLSKDLFPESASCEKTRCIKQQMVFRFANSEKKDYTAVFIPKEKS